MYSIIFHAEWMIFIIVITRLYDVLMTRHIKLEKRFSSAQLKNENAINAFHTEFSNGEKNRCELRLSSRRFRVYDWVYFRVFMCCTAEPRRINSQYKNEHSILVCRFQVTHISPSNIAASHGDVRHAISTCNFQLTSSISLSNFTGLRRQMRIIIWIILATMKMPDQASTSGRHSLR